MMALPYLRLDVYHDSVIQRPRVLFVVIQQALTARKFIEGYIH